MIDGFRLWLWRVTQPIHGSVFKWFRISLWYLRPPARHRRAPANIGVETVSVESENYFRPDKPANPARMWKKFAYNCEKLEGEGKIPKVDDHVELSIKAWEKAGYST